MKIFLRVLVHLDTVFFSSIIVRRFTKFRIFQKAIVNPFTIPLRKKRKKRKKKGKKRKEKGKKKKRKKRKKKKKRRKEKKRKKEKRKNKKEKKKKEKEKKKKKRSRREEEKTKTKRRTEDEENNVRGSYSARVPRSLFVEVHRDFVHHIVEDEVDCQEERQDDRR